MVGSARLTDGREVAVFSQNGAVRAILTDFDFYTLSLVAINDNGVIAGSAISFGHRFWFLATESQIFPLYQTSGGAVDDCTTSLFLNNQLQVAAICSGVPRGMGDRYTVAFADLSGQLVKNGLDPFVWVIDPWTLTDQGTLWGRMAMLVGSSD